LLVCLGHFLVFSAFIFFQKLFNTKPDQKYFKWYDVGLFAVAQILIRFPASNSTECMVCKKKYFCDFIFIFGVHSFLFFYIVWSERSQAKSIFVRPDT
jgi:hypothetical protein